MRSLAILLGCAALGWWIVAEYRRATREAQRREAEDQHQRAVQVIQERQQRFLRDLYAATVAPPAVPRVVESPHGVFIRGSCEAEIAETIALAPCFRRPSAA